MLFAYEYNQGSGLTYVIVASVLSLLGFVYVPLCPIEMQVCLRLVGPDSS